LISLDFAAAGIARAASLPQAQPLAPRILIVTAFMIEN
jgi:hypothetical protein